VKETEATITISTLILPAEKWQGEKETATIIIDVLRATTSIVVALAHAARAIYPVATIASAKRLAQKLPGKPLLAGERDGFRIPGFDLGNSPQEFQSPTIRGHPIVMCTTNGTKAIARFAGSGNPLYTASLVNLNAVARIALQYPHLLLVCSGKEGRFSLEDAFCAGGLISVLGNKQQPRLDDGGLACLQIWDSYRDSPLKLLQTCNHGVYLSGLGMGSDLEFCSQLDKYDIVPQWNGEALVDD
jgi:2-phosphosulfolactate phosphatase